MPASVALTAFGRGVAKVAVLTLVAVVSAGATAGEAPRQARTAPTDDFPAGEGGPQDRPAWRVASQWSVLDWAPGPLAGVVSASAYDTVVDGRTVKRVMVGSQANADSATADSKNNMSFSTDSGASFLTTKRDYPVSALNMARLPDGSLVSIDFLPEWTDDGRTAVYVRSWFSGDEGRTWRVTKGRFTPPRGTSFSPSFDRGLRVHRGVKRLHDGTLMVPAYTHYAGEDAGSSVILQSDDRGRSWTQRSRIPNDVGTNEVGWSRTTDGRLVAALRTQKEPAMLRVSFSDDDARTWSRTEPLLGPDGEQVRGIYPDLVLQPNGILLLGTGRPDSRAYVSYDGTGRTWDDGVTVHSRYPAETGNGRYDGDSGNNSLVNVAADRTVYFGDKCHTWGCGAYDEQFGVFGRYLSAVTSGVGKLDVATQLREGEAELAGDFAGRDATFPETRPEGAFDGSSAAPSAAVLHRKDGKAPSMVLELDGRYAVDRVGLMLGTGQPLDAAVRLSADGRTWSDPVVTAKATRDHAMRYTDFAAQDARYVKVTGKAGERTPVTELEVHAAGIQTFENDPIFSVPRGFTGARHAWTTDVAPVHGTAEMGGRGSSTALRLWDKWVDDNATATRLAGETDRRRVTFDWGVSAFGGPFVFGLNGRSTAGSTTPWKFRIVNGSPQSVEAFDGFSWRRLGTLERKVESFTWSTVSVDATTSEATVTVNGQQFTTSTTAADADALTGVTFSTGDPDAYGMAFFIDDLRM